MGLRDRLAAVCAAELCRQQQATNPYGVAQLLDMPALADAIIKELRLVEDSGVVVGCTHE